MLQFIVTNTEEHNKNLNLFLEASKADNLTFNKDKFLSISSIDLLDYSISHGVAESRCWRMSSPT